MTLTTRQCDGDMSLVKVIMATMSLHRHSHPLIVLHGMVNDHGSLVSRTSLITYYISDNKDRHWLPIEQRIVFKLCVLMHLVHIGLAPSYLRECVTACLLYTSDAADE